MTLCGSGKLYLDPTAMLEYKARADIPDSVTTDLLLIFPPHMITNFTDPGTTKNVSFLYAFLFSQLTEVIRQNLTLLKPHHD